MSGKKSILNRLTVARTLPLAALILVSLAVISGVAVAGAPSVSEERPDYVDCQFDEMTLEEYKPHLEIHHLDVQPTTLYGTYCTSPEYETDVAVYFSYYAVQHGVTAEDSHRHDREPVYVFVDEDTGEVESVKYTAYHYIKGVDESPDLDETNPQLHVVGPWNHYSTELVDESKTEPVDLRDFSEVHQAWFDNGWSANIEATAYPWTIQDKSSWWTEDSSWLDYQAAEWYWEFRLTVDRWNPLSDVLSDIL